MERDKKGRFVKGHKQLNTGKTHFQKGVKVRLGAKHTEESKKKMSLAHKKIEHNIEGLLDYKQPSGEESHMWKGDDVGYSALHYWVRREKGNAEKCETCGSTEQVEWANKSREYKRLLDDFISLCRQCHRKYDSGDNWGAATNKYKRL